MTTTGPLTVDATGLPCPRPVIMLARAAREAAAGTRIDVLATDEAAPGDIAAWCRMRGHRYVGTGEAPGRAGTSLTSVVVALPGTPPGPAG